MLVVSGRVPAAPPMDSTGSGTVSGSAARAYTYQAPEAGLCISVDFDVVDRLNSDFLRGLSALPRRGIEVGGILLGYIERPDPLTVRIEDYNAVPCEHLYGPSFTLSPKDRDNFEDLLARWAPAADRRLYAVGFYRSHTREPLQLTQEDLDILDAFFPGPASVCLLVKPFATRPGEAAFFVRQDGSFPAVPPAATFPFRRRELGGGPPPRSPRGAPPDDEADAPAPLSAPQPPESEPARASPLAPALPRTRGGWVWLPLSFIFFLVGLVLGFQLGLTSGRPGAPAAPADPYALGLSAVQFGDTIHLKWNTLAPALQSAQRAVLTIRDDANTKIIDLQKEDLARGAILYRYASSTVTFRLEAFLNDRNSAAESLDLRLLPPPPSPAPAQSPTP